MVVCCHNCKYMTEIRQKLNNLSMRLHLYKYEARWWQDHVVQGVLLHKIDGIKRKNTVRGKIEATF